MRAAGTWWRAIRRDGVSEGDSVPLRGLPLRGVGFGLKILRDFAGGIRCGGPFRSAGAARKARICAAHVAANDYIWGSLTASPSPSRFGEALPPLAPSGLRSAPSLRSRGGISGTVRTICKGRFRNCIRPSVLLRGEKNPAHLLDRARGMSYNVGRKVVGLQADYSASNLRQKSPDTGGHPVGGFCLLISFL